MTLRQGLLAALLAIAMFDGLDVRGAVGGVGDSDPLEGNGLERRPPLA